MSPEVVIIGAGITGSIVVSEIQRRLPNAVIYLLERRSKEGGRMTTIISPTNSQCRADIGAQYITTSRARQKQYKDIYNDLLKDNSLVPLEAKIEGMRSSPSETNHYVAPQGTGSLVTKFLGQIPHENIKFNYHVQTISKFGEKWVIDSENNEPHQADVVICTIPLPEVLKLKGTIAEYINKHSQSLNEVTYTNRFVLVLFYDKKQVLNIDWSCRYISDNFMFRFVSVDNMKRNKTHEPTAIVFHTSIEFSNLYFEKNSTEVEALLFDEVVRLFPNWPKPSFVKCHKWWYSQVQQPYRGQPGCLVLNENPLFILGGDAFTESNFNGCITSAKAVSQAIISHLGNIQ